MAQRYAKRNPYLTGYPVYDGGTERQQPYRRKGQPSRITPAERKRRRRKRMMRRKIACWVVMLVGTFILGMLTAGAVRLMIYLFDSPDADGSKKPAGIGKQAGVLSDGQNVQGISASSYAAHPPWEENFLTPNEYSRPGDALEEVKNIFVHYTANKGTSAKQNRSYFEQLKDTHERSASAHFIIGYEGEIIQCIPLNEIGYAVKTRNYDSISIECCYLSDDGSFTQETYDSLLSLLGWLMDTYGLEADDILRHYDCGGKECPVYYVEHEDAWEQLKKDAEAVKSFFFPKSP